METTALKKTNIAERLNLKALPIKDTFSVALITGFIIFILTVGFSMNGNLNRAQAQLENLTERIDRIEADTKEQFRTINNKIDNMDAKLDQILLQRQN